MVAWGLLALGVVGLDSMLRFLILDKIVTLCNPIVVFFIYSCIIWRHMIFSSCLQMCYRVLTCNVEILVWLYILILWKRKEKKDLLQFELLIRKNLQIHLGCISHTLNPFGFGVRHSLSKFFIISCNSTLGWWNIVFFYNSILG